MNDYLFSGILLASALAGGWIIYFAGSLVIRHNKAGFLKNAGPFFESIRGPVRLLLPALCLAAVSAFMKLPEKQSVFVSHLMYVVLTAMFGWLAVRITHAVRDMFLNRYDISISDNMRARGMHTQVRVIVNIIIVAIITVTASMILMSFSQVKHVGVSMLASAGVIGIVIGFAAQKTLGNLIAGIQIAVAQPIRLDDVVIIEGEWGRIEEITLTFVVVRIWDLRRLVVPISYFLETPFQNWTRTSADILGTVFIYADYTVPVDEVRAELERILEKSPLWDKKIKGVQVTDATERTVEIRALMSTANSSNGWDLRCEVREKLLKFLQDKFPGSLPKTRVEMEREKKPQG